MRKAFAAVALLLAGGALPGRNLAAQQPAAPTARGMAPVDVTGYWVAVVTEDWRWRMVTPAKGDAVSIPVNARGQDAANAWDYAKDVAAGNQCKAYGAGGLFRLPTRLHITWQDDHTLKINTDAGQQTQLFHFDGSQPAAGERTPQGMAVARWIDVVAPGGRGGRGGRGAAAAAPAGGGGAPAFGTGGIMATLTNLNAGYLRKNGVPYSENAVVTEYLDRVPGPGNAQWLVIKTIVDDPTYLAQAYITSSHFKQEPDGSKWQPSPCQVAPPLMPGRSQSIR